MIDFVIDILSNEPFVAAIIAAQLALLIFVSLERTNDRP